MKINTITPIKFSNYKIQNKKSNKNSSVESFPCNEKVPTNTLKAYSNISFGVLAQKSKMTDKQREALLNKMRIDYKKNEDGEYTISRFNYPIDDFKIKPKDLTSLFEKVVEIEGNAIFDFGSDFSLGALKKIGGNASFKHSNIRSLNNIETIKGDADFSFSEVQDLGALKNIYGNANFRNSKVKTLKNLERIGKNAKFEHSKISDFGKLKRIGGNAYFRDCKAKSTDNIELINGYAYFGYSNIRDISNLRFVKYQAIFNNSKVPEYQQERFIQKNKVTTN